MDDNPISPTPRTGAPHVSAADAGDPMLVAKRGPGAVELGFRVIMPQLVWAVLFVFPGGTRAVQVLVAMTRKSLGRPMLRVTCSSSARTPVRFRRLATLRAAGNAVANQLPASRGVY